MRRKRTRSDVVFLRLVMKAKKASVVRKMTNVWWVTVKTSAAPSVIRGGLVLSLINDFSKGGKKCSARALSSLSALRCRRIRKVFFPPGKPFDMLMDGPEVRWRSDSSYPVMAGDSCRASRSGPFTGHYSFAVLSQTSEPLQRGFRLRVALRGQRPTLRSRLRGPSPKCDSGVISPSVFSILPLSSGTSTYFHFNTLG